MSPLVALAVSIALLGGVASVLFLTQGLLVWAGIISLACVLDAGGDAPALKRTLAGTTFGAVLGWVAMMLLVQVSIPEGSWLWMPRYAIVMGITLLALGLAAKFELLSRISFSLVGCAVVLAAIAVPDVRFPGVERLTGFRMYNPLVLVVMSMVAGALLGVAAKKLAGVLAKP